MPFGHFADPDETIGQFHPIRLARTVGGPHLIHHLGFLYFQRLGLAQALPPMAVPVLLVLLGPRECKWRVR
jgi:hypothetical protein